MIQNFENYDPKKVNESLTPELKERIEMFADSENLSSLVDSLRLFTSEGLKYGFDKEDVKDYI